ncbi:MAG: ABC transporter permease [Oscillospiraceae bacterium]|nr:ABC transporter permease [Oscillospiraceae bacterium]
MAETLQNPAMVAMIGPAYATGEDYTAGVMFVQMMFLFTTIAVAVMNIFLVVRHTRKDEEVGRIEVIRSLPVGKLANLAGTLLLCVVVNTILALVIGFGIYAMQIENMDLAGSLVYGATLGASGILFGSIAAFFSQTCSTSRGAVSFSLMVLGIMYLLRAVGDVSISVLSYVSPLGLIMKTEPYYNNFWWPVLVILGLAVVISIKAFYLNSIRDLGAGLIPAKRGRREASKCLQSPMGLSLRLLKGTLITWLIVLLVFGVSYGAVFGDIETFLDGSEMMQQIFLSNDQFTISEQFMSFLMVIMSVVTTVPVLMIMLKIRTEEKKGRLEAIYAKRISRSKVLFNYLFISIVSSVLFVNASVFGLWSAQYAVMAEPIAYQTILIAGMSFLPAMWVLLGFAVLLIGLAPKITKLVWAALGLFFFLVYMGAMLDLPEWLINSTPFSSIPQYPVETFTWTPLLILTGIAAALITIGFIGYKKRDISSQ